VLGVLPGVLPGVLVVIEYDVPAPDALIDIELRSPYITTPAKLPLLRTVPLLVVVLVVPTIILPPPPV
jgi:hypothetical protein